MMDLLTNTESVKGHEHLRETEKRSADKDKLRRHRHAQGTQTRSMVTKTVTARSQTRNYHCIFYLKNYKIIAQTQVEKPNDFKNTTGIYNLFFEFFVFFKPFSNSLQVH